MRILAIDPGNTESGWCLIDAETRKPLEFGKWPNDDVIGKILADRSLEEDYHVVIEMVASYGMSVGAEVFETCVWIGRFLEVAWARLNVGGVQGTTHPELVKRLPVKVHHCHSGKATDSNIRQALVDRFAPGQPNHGKGTKAEPGWFYGFRADVWQAYALAVYAADTMVGSPPSVVPAPVQVPAGPSVDPLGKPGAGHWEGH